MDGEARQPARATLPEIWRPTCLPHEQLRLHAQGRRARLGKNWVSREPMKATLCLRRGEKQLATGTQVYTTPGQGERKGRRGADITGRRKPHEQNYLHFITSIGKAVCKQSKLDRFTSLNAVEWWINYLSPLFPSSKYQITELSDLIMKWPSKSLTATVDVQYVLLLSDKIKQIVTFHMGTIWLVKHRWD